MSTNLKLSFDVYANGSKLTRYEYNNTDSLSIGSGKDAILPLGNDPAVREIHALIDVRDGNVTLIPPKADGSIICNGDAVMKAVPLHSGAIIEIGSYSLQVTIADLGFAVEESTQVDEPTKPIIQKAPPTPAMAGAGALGAAMNEIYDDDVDPFEGVEEDVYQFVNRANTADVQTGTDASKPKVLQVFQIYDRAVLGHKTFEKGNRPHQHRLKQPLPNALCRQASRLDPKVICQILMDDVPIHHLQRRILGRLSWSRCGFIE